MMKKITMRTGVLCLALFAVACGRRTEPVDDAKNHDFIDSLVSLRNKGKTLRNEGNFDEALLLHNKGLTLAKQVNDTGEWVQALNNIGTDYRRMGLLDIAQEYHYEASRMCEESSDTSRTMRKNKVVSLNGLGNIYLTVKDYNRADSAFRKALKGERELGSATGQAINYANIGSIYSARGNDKEARRYYEMSMMMNERDSNTLGMSLCHTVTSTRKPGNMTRRGRNIWRHTSSAGIPRIVGTLWSLYSLSCSSDWTPAPCLRRRRGSAWRTRR